MFYAVQFKVGNEKFFVTGHKVPTGTSDPRDAIMCNMKIAMKRFRLAQVEATFDDLKLVGVEKVGDKYNIVNLTPADYGPVREGVILTNNFR